MGKLEDGFYGWVLALLAVFVWMALKAFTELRKSNSERGNEDVKKDN